MLQKDADTYYKQQGIDVNKVMGITFEQEKARRFGPDGNTSGDCHRLVKGKCQEFLDWLLLYHLFFLPCASLIIIFILRQTKA